MPETVEHHGVHYVVYEAPADHIGEQVVRCRERMEEFCRRKYSGFRALTDIDTLCQVFVHVDKRRLHYKKHHRSDINQVKEVATLCYWLIHYKPFALIEMNSRNSEIVGVIPPPVEEFCMWLIAAVINQYRGENGKTPADINFRESPEQTSLLEDLLYFLKHRITSPDSILALVEALAKA